MSHNPTTPCSRAFCTNVIAGGEPHTLIITMQVGRANDQGTAPRGITVRRKLCSACEPGDIKQARLRAQEADKA